MVLSKDGNPEIYVLDLEGQTLDGCVVSQTLWDRHRTLVEY